MAAIPSKKVIKQPVPDSTWPALVCCIGITHYQLIGPVITTLTGGIMKRFKNILFFADGSEEMTPALQRAAQLAESNQARLTYSLVSDRH